eukprot:TRINITY_DN15188_c0_g1_i4.p2 TRINITY_DN15188_c0_g1~~TRINITY_DN15188_c0_g1_i4.p2  ORF type:complete len:132 (-),score=16.03 TRINITY_DN15188_c0_g1_i4:64-459(-)
MIFVCVFFFFSSRRRHTRSCLVSWARRCVQETVSSFNYSKISWNIYILQVLFILYIVAAFSPIRDRSFQLLRYLDFSFFWLFKEVIIKRIIYCFCKSYSHWTVSYTHLTLPTICSVQISVVAGSLKKKNKR